MQEIKQINRSGAASILLIAIFANVAVRLSAPGAIEFAGLTAFLALLTALALLLLRTINWSNCASLSSLPAVVAVALFGMHPGSIAAMKAPVDANLIAGLAGVAAGIVICRWNPSRGWRRWAGLTPVLPCILLHRVGILFAPLLFISIWLGEEENVPRDFRERFLPLWPALIITVLAGFLHANEGFSPGAAVLAIPRIIAEFFVPFAPSFSTGWNTIDGVVATVAVAGIAIATAVAFRQPGVSFGLFWFLGMSLLAPRESLAAAPGLALATVSAIAVAAVPFFQERPSWLKAEL